VPSLLTTTELPVRSQQQGSDDGETEEAQANTEIELPRAHDEFVQMRDYYEAEGRGEAFMAALRLRQQRQEQMLQQQQQRMYGASGSYAGNHSSTYAMPNYQQQRQPSYAVPPTAAAGAAAPGAASRVAGVITATADGGVTVVPLQVPLALVADMPFQSMQQHHHSPQLMLEHLQRYQQALQQQKNGTLASLGNQYQGQSEQQYSGQEKIPPPPPRHLRQSTSALDNPNAAALPPSSLQQSTSAAAAVPPRWGSKRASTAPAQVSMEYEASGSVLPGYHQKLSRAAVGSAKARQEDDAKDVAATNSADTKQNSKNRPSPSRSPTDEDSDIPKHTRPARKQDPAEIVKKNGYVRPPTQDDFIVARGGLGRFEGERTAWCC